MPKTITETKETTMSSRNNQTAIWVATTVVFALLFFLSSVLDMKVKVTFGQNSTTTSTTTSTGAVRTTTPAGGIASQVGGC